MKYQGGCHCGAIKFEVEGEIDQVLDCNCSMCKKRGGLLWFVPREKFTLQTPESAVSTYTFNKHVLQHHFCAKCGIASYSEGEQRGKKMACINVRSLEGVDLASLKVRPWDGAKM
jgi:hypothetical protein